MERFPSSLTGPQSFTVGQETSWYPDCIPIIGYQRHINKVFQQTFAGSFLERLSSSLSGPSQSLTVGQETWLTKELSSSLTAVLTLDFVTSDKVIQSSSSSFRNLVFNFLGVIIFKASDNRLSPKGPFAMMDSWQLIYLTRVPDEQLNISRGTTQLSNQKRTRPPGGATCTDCIDAELSCASCTELRWASACLSLGVQ